MLISSFHDLNVFLLDSMIPNVEQVAQGFMDKMERAKNHKTRPGRTNF